MAAGQTLFDLAGRTALITGSSQGIGLALAGGLAAAGLNLLEQTPLPNTENDMEILATTLDMLAALDKKVS